MAARRKSSSGSGLGRFLLGFFCAVLVCGAGAYWYLNYGPGKPSPRQIRLASPEEGVEAAEPLAGEAAKKPSASSHAAPESAPVVVTGESAASRAPEGMGAVVAEKPAHAKPVIPVPPFAPSEDAYEAGARVYRKRCAGCHGSTSKDAPAGLAMTTPASQLWRAGAGHVGALQPGEIYHRIHEGAPKQGMPAFANVLPDSEVWDLALLLQQAGQPLPDPVEAILRK